MRWRSRIPETALLDLPLTVPVADSSMNVRMFYYWSNRTNWNTGSTPTSEVSLEGALLLLLRRRRRGRPLPSWART